MNIELLRKSLKVKWLTYYRTNRQWLVRLGVWVNCDGQRRPSSSFILATLAILEPKLTEMFPLVVELSNNPDRIVSALGLNFNPDDELKAIAEKNGAGGEIVTNTKEAVRMLPSSSVNEVKLSPPSKASNIPSLIDESCQGAKGNPD